MRVLSPALLQPLPVARRNRAPRGVEHVLHSCHHVAAAHVERNGLLQSQTFLQFSLALLRWLWLLHQVAFGIGIGSGSGRVRRALVLEATRLRTPAVLAAHRQLVVPRWRRRTVLVMLSLEVKRVYFVTVIRSCTISIGAVRPLEQGRCAIWPVELRDGWLSRR